MREETSLTKSAKMENRSCNTNRKSTWTAKLSMNRPECWVSEIERCVRRPLPK